MPAKTQNRCYGARYGERYGRNFAAPRRRPGETWTEYHDRLAAMTVEARRRGAVTAAAVLERKAGEVALRHKIVRTKTRKGSKGPGTYPWAACIKDARARGARDPAAVCGAIRAASRKRYPVYWRARSKAKNPSTTRAKMLAKESMEAAAFSVKEAVLARNSKSRTKWLMSAAMYAGEGVVYANVSGDAKLIREARDVALTVAPLVEDLERTPPKTKRSSKKKKPVRKKKNTAAIMSGFMRGT
jgi:hypothetical protein